VTLLKKGAWKGIKPIAVSCQETLVLFLLIIFYGK
jgi:hypothetical protein